MPHSHEGWAFSLMVDSYWITYIEAVAIERTRMPLKIPPILKTTRACILIFREVSIVSGISESAECGRVNEALELSAGQIGFGNKSQRAKYGPTRVMAKLAQLFREEFAGLHLRLFIARLLLWPLPIHVGGRVRVYLLRLFGFPIGHGTVMAGMPAFTGGGNFYRQLKVGHGCWFNVDCFFDLGAPIEIGNNVSIGHQVIILTTSHEIGPSMRRASTTCSKPVAIGNGAWIGARITILPGVNIGAGAVVAAGSVVNEDVPPDTLVAGVPARVIRVLS